MKVENALSTLLALSVTTACRDFNSTGPSVDSPTAQASHASVEGTLDIVSGEQLFIELSKLAPSSAGFAYEGDQLVVYIANEADRAAAESFIRQSVQQQRILPPGGGRRIAGVSAKKVKYSYAQLSTYRERVADLLLGQDPQLQFLDLDERANSITLGYSLSAMALRRVILSRSGLMRV